MKRSLGFRLLVVLVFSWRAVLAQVQSVPHHEVSALVAFKRAAFEDPFSALSDWDSVDGSPCSWTGVTCSANRDCVVSLNLSGSSLKGFLTPELKNLGCLQELHLNNNLLLGTIPAEIGMLKNLTVLDLSINRLTGPIPPILGELIAVNKLDLHSNGLTGSIPPGLGKLANLVELRLDRNRLGGQIPGGSNLNVSATSHGVHATDSKSGGLCQLSKLRIVDFSYNFLVGQIPSCLKYLQRSSFQGNCFQDKYAILQRTTKSCHSNKNQAIANDRNKQSIGEHNKHQSPQQPAWLLILEVTTGFLVVVFIITGIATAVRTCRLKTSEKIHWKKTMSWKDDMAISIDGDMLKNVLRFSREELEIACEDFSNIIGTSPHSMIYKGTMKDSTEVAVISLCNLEDQWTNYLELSFHNKVADLARLDHENLAKLLGYCKENEPFSRMLVLGYASNGTLYEHLHYGDGSQLSWIRRMKIILGVARGLRYFHTELQPPFVLSEMSSNAVYLTEEFSPKLVDFESWKIIFSESKKSAGYSSGVSLPGYNVPREQQEMGIQANIFAFGVLLLEIISGRPPYCKERGCLINWATKYLQNPEEISKLVDPELKNTKSEDLAVICSVVSLCIEPDPTKRPSMQIITAALENGIDLSAAALLKDSPLAWAELALSS